MMVSTRCVLQRLSEEGQVVFCDPRLNTAREEIQGVNSRLINID